MWNLPNISNEDYVLIDTKTNKPIENYDIVYHYTTIIDMINNWFLLSNIGKNIEIMKVASLSVSEQVKYNDAIQKTKEEVWY